MAIFVNEHTKVIVQGLTGGQGKYHGLRNKAYGTQVVGGVTPGKGGTDVEGVPVFNTVAEAVAATGATASFIAVPPKAAAAAILEAAAAGAFERPRFLQLKATSFSARHCSQRSRRKPCARMPHSKKASNSSLMNRGNSAPVLASVWAMKLAACSCTKRYSVVCSGRWRS
jgi:hypothetical protein